MDDDNVDLEEDVETEFMETTACEDLKDFEKDYERILILISH